MFEHAVRVRAAARLDVMDQPGIPDVADVEDPNAAKPTRVDGRHGRIRAAVDGAGVRFDGDEEQITEDGHVVLRAGAAHGRDELRTGRVGYVPHHGAMEVALDRVLPGER